MGQSIAEINAARVKQHSKNLFEFLGGFAGVILLLVAIGLILYYALPKISGFTSIPKSSGFTSDHVLKDHVSP